MRAFRLDPNLGPNLGQSLNRRLNRNLKWFVAASAAAHVFFAVLASVTIKHSYFETPGAYTVMLVSEPQEVIKLPKTEEEKAPDAPEAALPAKEKAAAQAVKNTPLPVAKKGPDSHPESLTEDLLDKDRKIRELEERRYREEALKRVGERAKSKEVSVGEADSQAPHATGAAGRDEESAYYRRLGAAIKSYWRFPGGGKTGKEAIVSITAMKNGILRVNRIEKSSGNAMFDESALRAVKKASPFEPPPSEYEILLRFSDEDL